jgi:hypothetical protein
MSDTVFVNGVTLSEAAWFNDLNDAFYTALGGVDGAGTITKVQFPATQVPSADANALDDYEEATFTPALAFGGGSTGLTYSNRVGRATKVGNRMFVSIAITLSAKGSSTGTATVTGLPVATSATANLSQSAAVWANTLSSITGQLEAFAVPSATSLEIDQLGTGTASALTHANFNDTSQLFINFNYEV